MLVVFYIHPVHPATISIMASATTATQVRLFSEMIM